MDQAWMVAFAGKVAGKLSDPLAYAAMVSAIWIGLSSLTRSFTIGVFGTAITATAVNILAVWDWWEQLFLTRSSTIWLPRLLDLLAVYLILCFVAWGIAVFLKQWRADPSVALAPPALVSIGGRAAGLWELISSTHLRYWAAASIVWVLVVLVVFAAFDPLGRHAWRNEEWLKFAAILLSPSTLGLLALALFAWAGRDDGRNPRSSREGTMRPKDQPGDRLER